MPALQEGVEGRLVGDLLSLAVPILRGVEIFSMLTINMLTSDHS